MTDEKLRERRSIVHEQHATDVKKRLYALFPYTYTQRIDFTPLSSESLICINRVLIDIEELVRNKGKRGFRW